MKFLHTSDWHLGKTMRGQSRIDEQRKVMAEIVEVARADAVDVALVVGDIFETSAPSPDAFGLAWGTLLGLRQIGAQVVVVAGNHDSPLLFDAFAPLARAAGITLLGHPARPDDGGVVDLTCHSGEVMRLALLPFCSQRGIVKAAQLLTGDAASHAGLYAKRVAEILKVLSDRFSPDVVNVVAAHCMVRGGKVGGGERDAQTIEDYYVDASAFGSVAHYVALGHLHMTQQLAGGCPIWYSGSPFQVDFGEEGDDKHVLVVEASPGVPVGTPRKVRLSSPRRLRTLRQSMPELAALAGTTCDDLLRIYVTEKARAGLAEEVRAMFPFAVDVLIERTSDDPSKKDGAVGPRPRSPHEAFAAYLASCDTEDPRIEALFAQLLDQETTEHRSDVA